MLKLTAARDQQTLNEKKWKIRKEKKSNLFLDAPRHWLITVFFLFIKLFIHQRFNNFKIKEEQKKNLLSACAFEDLPSWKRRYKKQKTTRCISCFARIGARRKFNPRKKRQMKIAKWNKRGRLREKFCLLPFVTLLLRAVKTSIRRRSYNSAIM